MEAIFVGAIVFSEKMMESNLVVDGVGFWFVLGGYFYMYNFHCQHPN